jgi:hypothetical protein
MKPRRHGGGWLFAFFLTLQTCGVVMLYGYGVPLYRRLVADISTYEVRGETTLWVISGIAFIQIGYWSSFRFRPALRPLRSAVPGHFLQFLSALSFTLGTAIFSFVFLTKKLAEQMPVSRYVLTFLGLFSLFLYRQELQKLGSAILPRKPDDDAANSSGAGRVDGGPRGPS